jgi:hypothetical protein
MATIIRSQRFSEAKKAVIHSRKISHWTGRILTETGAWILAGFVYFVMVEVVIWIAAMVTA